MIDPVPLVIVSGELTVPIRVIGPRKSTEKVPLPTPSPMYGIVIVDASTESIFSSISVSYTHLTLPTICSV